VTIYTGSRPAATERGNLLAAVLFGLAHLPAAAGLVSLTVAAVAAVLILNVSAGLVFGWLYWRYGVLLGIAAHVAADSVLHVLVPLVDRAVGGGGPAAP
jgi:membrane protease YdiL (CAAX protease family)